MANNKRPRSEELHQPDDSMQSLVSEFNTKSNRDIEDLCKFMASYVEKSEEYRRTLSEITYQHRELQRRVENIEEKLDAQNEKRQENSDQIELVERDLKEFKETGSETEGSVHKLEQKQIDTHIFISGFPTEPDEKEVTSSLMAFYDIPEDSIDFKYSYKFTPKKIPNATSTPSHMNQRATKTHYQMVIAFKDHQTKSKLMKSKREKGPIAYEQLSNKQMSMDEAKVTIRCVNRLSKFNLKVQRELLTAKNQQHITSFQLHNGLFRMKVEENLGWKIIDTEAALKPYISSHQQNNIAAADRKKN